MLDGGSNKAYHSDGEIAVARGVCIGRPYLWGLGAFGQAGVERVLKLLRIETRAVMQPCSICFISICF